MLQLVSALLVAYSYFLIRTNLPHLPTRIPTHFNGAGAADGWGSPDTLWFLFGTQVLTWVVFLIVPYLGQRFPGMVHLGTRRLSDYSPAQRVRMLPLLNDMAGYMCIVMNLFFVWMLNGIIKAATEPIPHIEVFGPLALLIGGMLGITLYYLARFRRAAQVSDNGDTSGEVTP
jgi:uncharacterized membrane protein